MSLSDNATALEPANATFELTNWDTALKGRRRLFVLYYCTDGDCFMNTFKAYQKAYTRIKNGVLQKPGTDAAPNASRMLRDPAIKTAIGKLLQRAQEEVDIKTTYQLLRLYRELAFYNPADIIDAKGMLKVGDLAALGETAKCITGITRKVNDKGLANYEVKLADRFKAMDSLMKYLELVRESPETGTYAPIILLNTKDTDSELVDVTPKNDQK
jgi:hypothetical protein